MHCIASLRVITPAQYWISCDENGGGFDRLLSIGLGLKVAHHHLLSLISGHDVDVEGAVDSGSACALIVLEQLLEGLAVG